MDVTELCLDVEVETNGKGPDGARCRLLGPTVGQYPDGRRKHSRLYFLMVYVVS